MRVSPAEYIVKLLGGQTAVAAIVGTTRQGVHRWMLARDRGGLGGKVPLKYVSALVREADRRGLDVTYRDLVEGREVDGRTWRHAS